MKRNYPRPYIPAERCQYIYNLGLKDEHPCDEQLIPPEQLYCKLHNKLGPKQNKAITQKQGGWVPSFRVDKRDQYLKLNSYHQYRFQNGFTKPKLKSPIDRAKTRQEVVPSSKLD